jgi:hypothetical protein
LLAGPQDVVPAAVLAGELVDVLLRALDRQLGRSADRDPPVPVVAVEHEDRSARVTLQLDVLLAGDGDVEEHVLAVAVPVDPDGGLVRRAVGAQRRDDGVVVREEKRGLLVGEVCHLRLTVPASIRSGPWV